MERQENLSNLRGRSQKYQDGNDYDDDREQEGNQLINEGSQNKTQNREAKSFNFLVKILILAGILVVFYLINSHSAKQKVYYENWKNIVTESISCKNDSFLFENKCIYDCPTDFKKDTENNICVPNNFSIKQISKSSLPLKNGKSQLIKLVIKTQGFNDDALDDASNDRYSGLIFFNDISNFDYSFLLHKVNNELVQNFLIQLNGVIVTFSGADSLYSENEDEINEQIQKLQDQFPQVSSWYTCGMGFSGGFNGLKYFLQNINVFKGTFLLDPLENISDFKEIQQIDQFIKQNFGEKVLTNLKPLLKKNLHEMQKNNKIFLFKNKFYQNIKTPILNQLSSPSIEIFTFFENNYYDYNTRIKYLTTYIFPMIEQQISNSKKDSINNFN